MIENCCFPHYPYKIVNFLFFFFYKISIFKKWVAYIELYENEIIILVFLLIHNYVVERG